MARGAAGLGVGGGFGGADDCGGAGTRGALVPVVVHILVLRVTIMLTIALLVPIVVSTLVLLKARLPRVMMMVQIVVRTPTHLC